MRFVVTVNETSDSSESISVRPVPTRMLVKVADRMDSHIELEDPDYDCTSTVRRWTLYEQVEVAL